MCRRAAAAAAAFAFAFAHGGQAVVPAAAALHGANNHENCSCGLENDVPPPTGTKSRHPPPTQAAQRRCPAGHAAMPNQQHGRPSRLLRPWACLELKGRHGCSPRHVAGSVNEPTAAGSAVPESRRWMACIFSPATPTVCEQKRACAEGLPASIVSTRSLEDLL